MGTCQAQVLGSFCQDGTTPLIRVATALKGPWSSPATGDLGATDKPRYMYMGAAYHQGPALLQAPTRLCLCRSQQAIDESTSPCEYSVSAAWLDTSLLGLSNVAFVLFEEEENRVFKQCRPAPLSAHLPQLSRL